MAIKKPAPQKPPPTYGIPPPVDRAPVNLAEEALNRASGGYQEHIAASGGIRSAIERALAEADPTVKQLRESYNATQGKIGSVFANSEDLSGITDPRLRERERQIRQSTYAGEGSNLRGMLGDAQATQAQTAGRFADVFDATGRAKQFDVSQREAALNRATSSADRSDDMRTRALERSEDRGFQTEMLGREQQFSGRFDDLDRALKQSQLISAGRGGSSGGSSGSIGLDGLPKGVTYEDVVKNPLLEFFAKGGRRIQDAQGGYGFFDPTGKPITVEEAMTMTTAGTKNDFLSGSINPQDKDFSGIKAEKPDPEANFQADLAAGLSAIKNKAKKMDVRARLIGQYPGLTSAIDAALGLK